MNLYEVSTDDLFKEIESRCKTFICAYETFEDVDKKKEAFFYYGKGNWMAGVRLASILNNDVLNNWNNELKKMQRFFEDSY